MPLPTHKFTILHKVISTWGSFTVFSLLLFIPLFLCLPPDLPSYVKPSVKEGSLFTIFRHPHTSPAWQEYVVLAIKHKRAGRRRIRERLQCRDRGFTERDEERQIEEVRALTLSWQRRTLSGWFLPLNLWSALPFLLYLLFSSCCSSSTFFTCSASFLNFYSFGMLHHSILLSLCNTGECKKCVSIQQLRL